MFLRLANQGASRVCMRAYGPVLWFVLTFEREGKREGESGIFPIHSMFP